MLLLLYIHSKMIIYHPNNFQICHYLHLADKLEVVRFFAKIDLLPANPVNFSKYFDKTLNLVESF